MTDKIVRVRLQALVHDYQRGMAQAQTSTARVGAQAGQTRAAVSKLGLGMTAFGFLAARELKKSAQAGIEFEAAMSKIVGLVGVAREQVNAWAGDFARIGPALGAGQTELADAMFFVTSAGLRGAEAMEVLEASTRAAKAGLGDIKTVADVATSAMNAYGAENLSATAAVDVLVATVREGKMAPEELSSSLGKVIPLAAKLGITFDQLGASVAVMTRTGLNAAAATTALRGVMTTLTSPSDAAVEALASVGLSMADLRAVAAGDAGLLGVLHLLDQSFGDNVEAMNDVVPNARALTGVLNILGQDAELVAGVFDAVADSAGDGKRAYEEWSDTAEASIDRFLAKVDQLRTQGGAGLAETTANFADIGFFLLQLADNAETASGSLMDLRLDPPGGLMPFIRGLKDLGGVLGWVADKMPDPSGETERLQKVFKDATDAADLWRRITSGGFRDVGDAAGSAGDDFSDFADDVDDARTAVEVFAAAMADLRAGGIDVERALIRWRERVDQLSDAFEENGTTLDVMTEKGRANRAAIGDAADALLDYAQKQIDAKTPIHEVTRALEGQIGELVEVMRQAGFTEDQIESYIDILGLVPEEIVTAIVAEIEDAMSGIEAVGAALAGLTSRRHMISIGVSPADIPHAVRSGLRGHRGGTVTASGIVPRMHGGGTVGGLRHDMISTIPLGPNERHAILEVGEVVLTGSQAAALERTLAALANRPDSTSGSGITVSEGAIQIHNPSPQATERTVPDVMRDLEFLFGG